MASVRPGKLPEGSFLHEYLRAGAYADCYVTEVASAISQAEYVEAFYSTWLFKLERFLLAWLVARPSTDRQATQLAAGTLTVFAAWNVERQDGEQLLLADFRGRTRSWLMALPLPGTGTPHTRLHFGSAVVPKFDPVAGRAKLGFPFQALLGFHKLYSHALLKAAVRRLAH